MIVTTSPVPPPSITAPSWPSSVSGLSITQRAGIHARRHDDRVAGLGRVQRGLQVEGLALRSRGEGQEGQKENERGRFDGTWSMVNGEWSIGQLVNGELVNW